ncbi:MAG: hypothetical protein U9N06_00030 [candidate division WOR-3 bacterium]|nr:hypothetical protein [candidate division WOR-3 bacterium]
MILLFIFAISIEEVTHQIEEPIFKDYYGTVQVAFEQGSREMEITKSGKEILILGRFTTPETGRLSVEFTHPERKEIGKKTKPNIELDRYSEQAIAYYDGKKFIGCAKEYFVSFILFGCHCGFLYGLEEIEYEGRSLIGKNGYGLRIDFDRQTKLPKVIKYGRRKYVINEWRRVEGFGKLPAEMEIWVNNEKKETRRIKSVRHPSIASSFFTYYSHRIPIVLE